MMKLKRKARLQRREIRSSSDNWGFHVVSKRFISSIKIFLGCSGFESFVAAGWFCLPALYVHKFTSYYFFWVWLFLSFWAICFSFDFVLNNPAYRVGCLLGSISGLAKNIYRVRK